MHEIVGYFGDNNMLLILVLSGVGPLFFFTPHTIGYKPHEQHVMFSICCLESAATARITWSEFLPSVKSHDSDVR